MGFVLLDCVLVQGGWDVGLRFRGSVNSGMYTPLFGAAGTFLPARAGSLGLTVSRRQEYYRFTSLKTLVHELTRLNSIIFP